MAQLFLLGTPRDEYSLDRVPTQRISTVPRSNSNAAAFCLTRSRILRSWWRFINMPRSKLAGAFEIIELRRNFSGFRHRVGTECRGAGERRRPVGKIGIIDVDV